MPSGRATARSARGRTRSCGSRSSAILSRDQNVEDLERLEPELWEARHEAGYLDDIALYEDDYRLLGAVSEPERSRILFRRALAELKADPWRYAAALPAAAAVFHLLRRDEPQVAGAGLSRCLTWG